MTTVIFEASTIVSVIKRVEKAAPPIAKLTDNMGLAGIVIDILPDTGQAIIRATNGSVFYREMIDVLEAEGERISWRLSSSYLARIIATFKSNSGSIVRFAQVGNLVEMTQDRKRATLGLMSLVGYPDWFESSTEDATMITDLGAKIKLIAWAGSPSDPILGSIYMRDGYLYATNRAVMARVPCTSASDTPILIDADEFTSLIDQRGDMAVKIVGGTILLAPNDRTQIRSPLVDQDFPPVYKAVNNSYPCTLNVYRDEFLKLIRTTESVQGKDKDCVMRLFIGDKQIAGIMQQQDEPTAIRDIIDVTGGAEHPMYEVDFNPAFISAAVSNSPTEEIEIHYDPQRPRTPIMISGEGYEAWVTPVDMAKRMAAA